MIEHNSRTGKKAKRNPGGHGDFDSESDCDTDSDSDPDTDPDTEVIAGDHYSAIPPIGFGRIG